MLCIYLVIFYYCMTMNAVQLHLDKMLTDFLNLILPENIPYVYIKLYSVHCAYFIY